jgi:hypothetical protein
MEAAIDSSTQRPYVRLIVHPRDGETIEGAQANYLAARPGADVNFIVRVILDPQHVVAA